MKQVPITKRGKISRNTIFCEIHGFGAGNGKCLRCCKEARKARREYLKQQKEEESK